MDINKIKNIAKRSVVYEVFSRIRNKHRADAFKKLNDAFKIEAVDVLKCFCESLSESNIQFWLMAGTLLGYYREHDFISHDYDLDTGAWFSDHDKIKAVLEKNGFERVRLYYLVNEDGMEESYKHKDYLTTIDVFYFVNDDKGSYHYSFQPLVSMKKKKQLNKEQPSLARRWSYPTICPIPAVFKGIKVFVPDNTAQHLASTYGETFMTPIKDFPVLGRPNLTEYTYEEKPAIAFLSIGYF